MKLLVLTSEPITAQQLRDAISDGLDSEQAEVMVVAPAFQESPLKFWMSDADEAIARANEVSASTTDRLEREGIPATGDSGESDPMKAVEDALLTFEAERIVLFKRPEGQQAYREDLDPGELETRFGLPVDQAVAPPS